MRVMHVSMPLSWRGGEQQLLYLAKWQNENSESVVVLTSKGSELERRCKKRGIPVFCLPSKWPLHPFNFWFFFKHLSRFEPQLIHLHDSHAHLLVFTYTLLFFLKIPLILSRRVDFLTGGNPFSAKKLNHPSIKRIICVSQAIKEMMLPVVNHPIRLVVIHDGIDLERFSTEKGALLRQGFHVSKDAKIIGNVAALADHKDYFTFIDVAARLLNEGLKAAFFLIGDGPLKKQLQQRIKELNLEKSVFITGFRRDIELVLPELDVFLFTSKTEGLGTSVLDAMAAGVPVVATKAGGIPEIIRQEENGLLAPAGDSKMLARQVLRVLADDSLRAFLVKNGYQTAKEFEFRVMASKTNDLYQEVLNEQGRSN